MIEQSGAIYLENSGINIEGLNIWGSPVTPYFMDWEWNLPRDGQELRKTWAMIPNDTDILITHGPPYGILDNVVRIPEPQGCKLLKKRVMQLPNLKLSVFGHLHDGFGVKPVANTIFVNAAMCDDKYNVSREPVVIDI
jgi:Icc-related predicted phosphoesterase